MEVALLWLDDLDDLLFTALAAAERLRRACLQIGLGAALTLLASELAVIEPAWTAACAATAVASVGLWLTVLLGGHLSDRPEEPAPTTA